MDNNTRNWFQDDNIANAYSQVRPHYSDEIYSIIINECSKQVSALHVLPSCLHLVHSGIYHINFFTFHMGTIPISAGSTGG